MIEDSIRSAFEHIDGDPSDEFRDALHARLLAEFGDDTNDDESDAAVSLASRDAESTSGRWWPILLIAAAAVVLVVSALVVVTRDDARETQVGVARRSALRPRTA
jgi:hypothetical protein